MIFKVVAAILIFALTKVKGEEPFQCHDLFEHDASTPGEVTSPFYGQGEYHNKLWCEYRITAPEGHRIKLTFKDLDLEKSGLCRHDQLVVYSKDKEEVLGKFCGSNLPNPVLSHQEENEIRLLFLTDYMIGGRGFRIRYESGPGLELCSEGKSQCRNRNCYESDKKCDGRDDCGDGTDEENCGSPAVGISEDCGRTPIQPILSDDFPDRQVGGLQAIPNSWPWTVSLQMSYVEPNGHICGGSIISPLWVVTAGHCVKETWTPSNMKIVIGSHNKFKTSKYEVTRIAEKIISYPDLQFQNMFNYRYKDDIALIKLNAPVIFNDGVQPVCLPSKEWEPVIGSRYISVGWGETRGSGFSDSLKQTDVVAQDIYNCGFDPKVQMCVARPFGAPCQGDSGGPLMERRNGKWYVVGATSMGLGTTYLTPMCALPGGSKVIFSKISSKIDWIHETIGKYS